MPIVASLYPIASDLAPLPPFADALNLTVPTDAAMAIQSELLEYLGFLCLTFIGDGTYILGKAIGVGSFKYRHGNGYTQYSLSGGFLGHLRNFGRLADFLMLFASHPYTITRLDVTQDYLVPDASPYVLALPALARTGRLHLTRKAVVASDCKKYFADRTDGIESGTFYINRRSSASTYAKVYDKALEQFEKYGRLILPTLRIEFTVGKQVKATLRDVTNPSDLYYSIASKSLVIPPPSHKGWQPHGLDGFIIEKMPVRTLKEQIEALELYSDDVIKYNRLKADLARSGELE